MVAAVTTSGERVGRSPWAAATNGGDGQALESALELVRGAEGELAHLGERLDAGPAGRTLGDDEDPDGLDAAVSALGRSVGSTRLRGPGGLERVEGIGLAGLWRRAWRFWRSTSTTWTPARARKRAMPAP